MRKILPLFAISLLILSLWLFWPSNPDSSQSGLQENRKQTRSVRADGTLHDRVLARVRLAASSVLPNIDFEGKESIRFSQIHEPIEELDVMEVILAIETEFDLDLSQAEITARLGRENHRDLRDHLSLAILAELVVADQVSASPQE